MFADGQITFSVAEPASHGGQMKRHIVKGGIDPFRLQLFHQSLPQGRRLEQDMEQVKGRADVARHTGVLKTCFFLQWFKRFIVAVVDRLTAQENSIQLLQLSSRYAA